jgi:hypothetical protein
MKRSFLVALATATALTAGPSLPAGGQVPPTVAIPAVGPSQNVQWVGGANGFTGGHVVVQGDRLYLGAYGIGMRIFDISTPATPSLIGQYIPGGLRADAVPDAADYGSCRLAVLNGTRRLTQTSQRTDRSEFLDVTNPAAPRVLHTFEGQADGEAHNGDIADERRLWLPSGGTGANGLRIYDITPITGCQAAAPVNIFRGDPVTLWERSPFRKSSMFRKPVGPAFTHTHDITIYLDYPVVRGSQTQRRDIILLAEGGNYADDNGNTGSVFVIDITDPRNPVVLQRWLHQRGPGHHPIRYHHEAQFLDGDQRLMIVTDEDLHHGCTGNGGAYAVRLTPNLQDATELSEWFIPTTTPAEVCSVHVFSSLRNLVFFGSYNAGLQVVDYTNPSSPVQRGFFVVQGGTQWGALYHNGVIFVGDMDRGLDVFRYTGPG